MALFCLYFIVWSLSPSIFYGVQAHPNVQSAACSGGVRSINCTYIYSISFWNLCFSSHPKLKNHLATNDLVSFLTPEHINSNLVPLSFCCPKFSIDKYGLQCLSIVLLIQHKISFHDIVWQRLQKSPYDRFQILTKVTYKLLSWSWKEYSVQILLHGLANTQFLHAPPHPPRSWTNREALPLSSSPPYRSTCHVR